jgi:uncharacterized protein YbjT (DUF2867 family)
MHSEPQTAWKSGAAEAVGVLGATSFVGQSVLERLRAIRRPDAGPTAANRAVVAFSRSAAVVAAAKPSGGVHWYHLPAGPGTQTAPLPATPIPEWIAVCPLWTVSAHLPLLVAAGARRLVAVSSTSLFTKSASVSTADRRLAARLAAAEEEVLDQARAHTIAATILRPTMIYDGIHDRNVMAIAGFIRRWGFFPVAGAAEGLRQPVHADDVAAAAVASLAHGGLATTYEISGGETLSYGEMVRRIFRWLDHPPRLVTVPLPLIRAAGPLVSLLPGLGRFPAMVARMNEDLVFDHGAATRDFGFHPRSFTLPLRTDSNHAAGTPHTP